MSNRKRGLGGASMFIISLAACGQPKLPAKPAPQMTARWCNTTGRTIDSAFAVDQARVALQTDTARFVLAPSSIDRVKEGLLIRLIVIEPRGTLGGGGLVWIDTETACAIVLTRYQ
jgi:hypothetical protein